MSPDSPHSAEYGSSETNSDSELDNNEDEEGKETAGLPHCTR